MEHPSEVFFFKKKLHLSNVLHYLTYFELVCKDSLLYDLLFLCSMFCYGAAVVRRTMGPANLTHDTTSSLRQSDFCPSQRLSQTTVESYLKRIFLPSRGNYFCM